MVNLAKILIFTLLGSLWAEYHPENGAVFNYTQIYFQWDQIPDAETYTLFIQEVGILEGIDFNTSQNSILLQDEFDWNSFYSWTVCSHSIAGELINCSDENIFSINPLPEYFPDDITILTYNESFSQNGITIMDIESLKFSTALDMNGNPIWFADKNNNAEDFISHLFHLMSS